jgi:hypothetical protein
VGTDEAYPTGYRNTYQGSLEPLQNRTMDAELIPHAATWLRGERWEDVFEITLPDVVNEKPWHESSTGITQKGKELGINIEDFPHFQDFRIAVLRAAMKAA